MLSDEEREALEILNNTEWNGFMITIKNLIKKQSKEIEELKFKYQARKDRTKKEIEELKENNKLLQENYSSAHEDINWFCENYISKEESEQRERKAYIKGTNDAHELCNKKWEDKIKAKIEEYEKELNKLLQKEEWLEPHDTIKRNKYMHYIEFGQSLLEKE